MSAPSMYDVAIAGAGPGGATLAALLAQQGLAVVLFDRDEFPRDKLCGEFLSYDALAPLELIGLLAELDANGATAIDRCRIVGPHARYELEFPHIARGISRLRLDAMLVRRAAALGANVREGWSVDAVQRTSDGFLLQLRDREREAQEATARILVGAWGRWGRIDRQLERPFTRDMGRRHFGFKRHYRSLTTSAPGDDESTPGAIDLYSFTRGYLGVNAVEGGTVNICGLVHASALDGLRGGWETFVDSLPAEGEHLRRLFASHEPAQAQFLSSEPVIFAARSPVVNGILMVGDAAGIIDPLAGNGMAMAIQSALVAAAAIVENGLRDVDATAAQYDASYRALFLDRIRWSRRVSKLLARPKLVDLATRLVRVSSIGSFLLARTRATDAQVEAMVGRYRSC
ncbi:MAG: NAD(P)/FAD-dependent oxidoreductase [Acidobacteria bacterium]|nr:NAD(P)/FAD-dependent oxidoreductase [Acidobacteriota bacterium]